MSAERLLLCRPLGGLNDVLCQIGRACAYADRFGRTVVVDTLEQSGRYFRDRFSNYFDSLQANLVLDADAVADRLDALDVSPSFIAGRVRACRPRYDPARQMFVDELSGRPITFDFEHDHAATLLVHHLAGGGVDSIRALARLRLKDVRLHPDAEGAVGGHRAPAMSGCTSATPTTAPTTGARSPRCPLTPASASLSRPTAQARSPIAACRVRRLDRVFSFAALPEDGSPPHHIDDPAQPYERNRDAILDLVMLATASGFNMLQIAPNPFGARFSGYSVLAANLRSNPTVLARLVGETDVRLCRRAS